MCILLNVKKHEKTFALNVDIFSAYSVSPVLRSPLVFFSTSFLAIMIWCPQPTHFRRKSAPTRRISHSLLPHGCCFFNRTTSPTSYLSINPLYSPILFILRAICCINCDHKHHSKQFIARIGKIDHIRITPVE